VRFVRFVGSCASGRSDEYFAVRPLARTVRGDVLKLLAADAIGGEGRRFVHLAAFDLDCAPACERAPVPALASDAL